MRHFLILNALIFATLFTLHGCNGSGKFIPTSDQELYGVEDKWTYPLEKGGFLYGDCEDYAIWKIEEAGKGELLVVETGKPEKHAVALIDGKVYDILFANTRAESDYKVITKVQWK